MAATVLGRAIVVAGGYLADGSSSREVDLYSPMGDSWRRAPDLPVGVNHASAVVARGGLYVIGGYGAERLVFRLDANGWRASTLPAPRAAAGAAALHGVVYVVGGVASNGLAREMLAFDPRRDRWSRLPGPTPRQHLAVTAARGRIYAVAGRIGGADSNLRVVESWAPGEKRWRRETPVPEARGGTGAAAIGTTIVSVGGEAPGGTLAKVFAYDVMRRTWRRLDDLSTPRHGLGVVAFAGRVYAIGGGTEPGLSVSSANESLRIVR